MARPYHDRALLLMRQGRHRNAADELLEGLREFPEDAYLHALLAIAYSNVGRGEEALREAQEAIGLDPGFAYSYYARATVLLALGRADEAETAAREAVALDPNHPTYYATLATTFLRRQRWTEALEAADRGLAVDPGHVYCANDRAAALLRLGREEEAVATLREALARDPESSETHGNLGRALQTRGERRGAVEHHREAVRLEPQSEWAREGLMKAIRERSRTRAWLHAQLLGITRVRSEFAWTLLGGSVVFVALGAAEGELDDGAVVFAGVMAFFALTWMFLAQIVRPLIDLLLFLDPVGREVLPRQQRVGAVLMAGALLLSLVSWVAVAVVLFSALPSYGGSDPLWTCLAAALSTTGLLVPLGAALGTPEGSARTAMEALTAFLYACAAVLVAAAGDPRNAPWTGALAWMVGTGIVASAVAAGLLPRREAGA